MKIFYDYQIFEHQIYGGISRYFYELIKGIEKDYRNEIQYDLPILQSSNHYIKKIPTIKKNIQGDSDSYYGFLSGIEFPGKWRLYQGWRKMFPLQTLRNRNHSILNLKRENFDLFHPTDIDDYFLDHIGNRPFVITIHDMIDEYFPEYSFHVHSNYKTSIKEKLIHQSAGIIAVSQSTKTDILERFNVDESKIKVIHHGTSDFYAEVSKPLGPEKYLLYIGKRTHYKNFYFFLQCAIPFLKEDPTLKIVCTGSPFNKAELAYFKDLEISDKLCYIDATDEALANLYRRAVAFIFPSLYEGFGMPILEAFKYGCPVLLSNSSSFPEVAGDAGLYFNPKSIQSIRSALDQILQNESLRADLANKGFARMKKFSWDKTLAETLSFYKTLTK